MDPLLFIAMCCIIAAMVGYGESLMVVAGLCLTEFFWPGSLGWILEAAANA